MLKLLGGVCDHGGLSAFLRKPIYHPWAQRVFDSPNCSASGVSSMMGSGLQQKGINETMNGPSTEQLMKEIEGTLGSRLGTGPQAPLPKPLVMVISGPSGVGKDAVIKGLQEVREKIHFVVTATSRAKRPGEIHGKDYFFVTKEQFESMIEKNELLEHAVVYGDYKGIPKTQVKEALAKGHDVVIRVDVQGAATVRAILGSSAIFIFVVAESEAALVKRLVRRKTETKEKLMLRIATAREEVKRMDEFDYVVVNVENHLDEAVSRICHIIEAEKSHTRQREARL